MCLVALYGAPYTTLTRVAAPPNLMPMTTQDFVVSHVVPLVDTAYSIIECFSSVVSWWACVFREQVYDPKTLRYDQPYATGNCAGEGTCGTCFVEVRPSA